MFKKLADAKITARTFLAANLRSIQDKVPPAISLCMYINANDSSNTDKKAFKIAEVTHDLACTLQTFSSNTTISDSLTLKTNEEKKCKKETRSFGNCVHGKSFKVLKATP